MSDIKKKVTELWQSLSAQEKVELMETIDAIKTLSTKDDAWQPVKVDEIPDKEKVEAFNSLYSMCLDMYNLTKQQNWNDEDNKNYVYEGTMNEVFAKFGKNPTKFWVSHNKNFQDSLTEDDILSRDLKVVSEMVE